MSIVVPCYNEEGTIGSLLQGILAQTFPRHEMEVVIADGLSKDHTRAVIEDFGRTHSDLALRVVDNVRRTIPSSLNLAIRAARGDILIRLDAHSAPIPEYVERCVSDLRAGKGANVGGVWDIRPGGPGWIARGIAAAAAHPLGAGDALYRIGATAGAVDTVPFGAFRRATFDEVQGFDETLLTNEDYEFNLRIRRAGGVVWLDPGVVSTYIARPTLRELAAQYWRYGYWKSRMLLRYPGSVRWRQALPPLFVLGIVGLTVLWPFITAAGRVLLIVLGIYLAAVLAAGIGAANRKRDPLLAGGCALALITMHLAWGSGFLWSLVGKLVAPHG